MLHIPDSYEESRARFLSFSERVRDNGYEPAFDSHSLSSDPSLTIDWCYAPARKSTERLFILTTGLHGIEGYIGAAMLELFITEFLPRFEPNTSGILLVHAINPWGMKHHQRTNPNNVDLNRNFGAVEQPTEHNADYDQLLNTLNPPGKVKSIFFSTMKFALQSLINIPLLGVSRIREAALMGQYRHEQGISFGGTEIEEETRMLIKLFEQHTVGYAQILHIDMHSGYGPRHQMTLVNPSSEPMTSAETARRFRVPRVASTNPEEFYTISGDMGDALHIIIREKFPSSHVYTGAFEFGTYGHSLMAAIRSLHISILKNQANVFGATPKAQAWIDAAYQELFLPVCPKWRMKAASDGRQALQGILNAHGFIADSSTA